MWCTIPESIGKLTNLEILDLKFSTISSLPDGILKLKNLCQLRGYDYNIGSSILMPSMHGISVPAGVGRLTNLQKLGNIEVNGNGKIVRDFGCLTQLRRLGILGLTQENGTDLCNSLEKMKHLTALYMVSLSTSEPLHLDSLSSHPQFLQRLYVKSSLASLPKWITSLEYLGKLVLQYSNLENDPLRALQNLPNLVVLELRDAYVGEELSCDVGGYPRLRNLALKQLWHLKSVRLAKGAMTALRGLGIASCEKLETVPSGIEDLRDLQHLWFWDMPFKFYLKIEPPHGEDFWKVQHIRTIE